MKNDILLEKFGVMVFRKGDQTLFSIPAQALKRSLCGDDREYQEISLLMRAVEHGLDRSEGGAIDG